VRNTKSLGWGPALQASLGPACIQGIGTSLPVLDLLTKRSKVPEVAPKFVALPCGTLTFGPAVSGDFALPTFVLGPLSAALLARLRHGNRIVTGRT
jgi:hypothetical protein